MLGPATDAVVTIEPVCPGPTALLATVRNIGQAALPSGIPVGFYEGTAPGWTLLGHVSTSKVLYPAESEGLTLVLVNPDQDLLTGVSPVSAVVDDGAPPHPQWHECRTDNNTSAAVSARCESPR